MRLPVSRSVFDTRTTLILIVTVRSGRQRSERNELSIWSLGARETLGVGSLFKLFILKSRSVFTLQTSNSASSHHIGSYHA